MWVNGCSITLSFLPRPAAPKVPDGDSRNVAGHGTRNWLQQLEALKHDFDIRVHVGPFATRFTSL
jgi:hypothetical protein